jgi:HPt (histidine-containing phosphotransfer) domain-containing protein
LLNVSALHARYPDNPGLVDELAAMFTSTTQASLDILKNSIGQHDAETARKEAHALKGAAASVMATVFHEGAARIETCLKQEDFAGAAAELAALENVFHAHA